MKLPDTSPLVRLARLRLQRRDRALRSAREREAEAEHAASTQRLLCDEAAAGMREHARWRETHPPGSARTALIDAERGERLRRDVEREQWLLDDRLATLAAAQTDAEACHQHWRQEGERGRALRERIETLRGRTRRRD